MKIPIWVWMVLSVIFIFGCMYYTAIEISTYDKRGTFGDMFGATNALFSGLALAGIIFTILLQRQELELQRGELKDTRKEFQLQNQTLSVQRFENTLFGMLSLQNAIVSDMDLDQRINNHPSISRIVRFDKQLQPEIERIRHSGRDVLEVIYKRFMARLDKDTEGGTELNPVTYYEYIYDHNRSNLSHYFRNLYRIFKLIDEADIDEIASRTSAIIAGAELIKEDNNRISERYKYTSIVRSQLSDFELLLLFYNGLSKHGASKFKPLIEKYRILKNVPIEDLHNPAIRTRYAPTAY